MLKHKRIALSLLVALAVTSHLLADAASQPGKEPIETYSLDKLYDEISNCYKTGDLARAATMYKQALVLIEKTGNKKALESAQANYKKLLEKLEAKSDGTKTGSAGTASTSTQPMRPGDLSGFSSGGKAPARNASAEFQKEDSSWRKKLDTSSNKFKAYDLDEQARELSEAGDKVKALATITEASKLWSDSGQIWYNKGLIESQLSKWEDSIASFQKAQNLNSELAFRTQKKIAQNTAALGNTSKATELLWKLKSDSRSDYSNEREIDGLLVQLVDEKAISNRTMLANANEYNLAIAIKKAAESKKTTILQELCKQFQSLGQNAYNERYMGFYLGQAGLYEDALSAFKRADDYAPSEKGALLGIMSMANQLGKLEEVQAAHVAYVERFPDDEKSKTFREEIAYYKGDFEKTRAREKQSSSVAGDRPHFAKSEIPLKVYVPDPAQATSSWAEPADPSIDYGGTMQRVLDDWMNASEGHVRFDNAQSPETANISIEWVEDKDKMDHSFAAGTTGIATNSQGQRRHNLKLLAPTKNHPMSSQDLYELILHEFGHALGLSHSSSTSDIMYYSSTQSGPSTLSENDKKRINELYK